MKLLHRVWVVFFFAVVLATSVFSLVLPDDTPSSKAYYILHYPAVERARAQHLLQEQLTIESYYPEDGYVVYASQEQLQGLLNQGIITDYTSYYDVVDYILAQEDSPLVYLHLFPSADKDTLLQTLASLDVPVVDQGTRLQVEGASLDDLRHLEGVVFIQEPVQFTAFNDLANTVSGTKDIRQRLGLYGEGQIIAIADTGLDTGKNDNSMHLDLQGSILSLQDYGGNLPTPWDKSGHGTHTSASILGNGLRSGSNPSQNQYDGSYAGAAPKARLVFQAIGYDDGSLTVWPPWPMATRLFLPSYQQGARVHSNSWGSISPVFFGVYEGWALDVDTFTSQYRDMLLVFAAGNFGSYSSTGYGTVIPPSLAKNTLSIGAVTTTDPNKKTVFSSMGYTNDNRVKPDLLAPGTEIISAKSTMALYPCWQPTNPYYCIAGGTSMATPNTAGIAALVREYYIKKQQVATPSAALIKATLINGADDIGYGRPSREAGWGRLNVSRSIPEDATDLVYFDERQGLTTSQSKTYSFFVRSGTPFRLTLVWTDKPGTPSPQPLKQLVNDLDVVVTDAQGRQYNGNDNTAPFNDQWDRKNNVEVVELQTPVNGRYTVQVRGFTIPLGAQDYALVATYDNAAIAFIPVTGAAICRVTGTPC